MVAMTVPLPVMRSIDRPVGVPLPATIAQAPRAVPLSVTSPVAKSLTNSLNNTVRWIGDVLVGSACVAAWLIVTVGAITSNVTVLSTLVEAVLALPATSWALPAAIVAMTVPLPVM